MRSPVRFELDDSFVGDSDLLLQGGFLRVCRLVKLLLRILDRAFRRIESEHWLLE